jgi:oligosaccharide repeat unit polymerase
LVKRKNHRTTISIDSAVQSNCPAFSVQDWCSGGFFSGEGQGPSRFRKSRHSAARHCQHREKRNSGSQVVSRVQNRSDNLSTLTLASFVRETSLQYLWLTLFLLIFPLSVWVLPPLALLSGFLIVASLWLMQRLVGLFNLKQLTIPGFFYYIYLAIILIPGFFVFREETTPSRWRFLFGIESVIITVPLGIWIANLVLDFRRQETANYFGRPLKAESLGASAKRLYLTSLALAIVLVLINLWETPTIPLFFLIRNPGEAMAAALLREDSFKLLKSHFTYAYFVLRGTVFPFLIMVAFGRYRQQRQDLWRRLFLVSLFLGVFYAAITIEKSPVATILGLLGVFYYLFNGGRLGKVATILVPVLFVSFPLIVVLLSFQGSEGGTLSGAFVAIGNRLFYSPAQVVYAYFELFPTTIAFQHGASLLKLAYLMGWKTVDIPNAVGLYMTAGQEGAIDTISANSCFIGNFYADFGLPGVVLSGVLAGFLMQSVNVYLCRKPKTVVNLAAYAICFWALGMLVSSALSTQMLSGGVAFALGLGWIFKQPKAVVPVNHWHAPSSSMGSAHGHAGG